MSWIDWAVCLSFLGYIVWDGVRRKREAGSLEGYFAAKRSIPWWAAGLSIMATQVSAITIIGTTGQGYVHGMEFVQMYFALPFAMILLCSFMVPLLRRLPILTAYEYLEGRFGPITRSLTSLIFLVSRSLAVGGVIYAPSVVLSAMTGVPIAIMVAVVGGLTTLYTMFGGVNAVIWTDVKQMTVIVVGLVVCVVILLQDLLQQLDLGQIFALMGGAGKLNAVELTTTSSGMLPRWKWDATGQPSFWEDKYNFWSGTFGSVFLFLAYFGCDQSQVQSVLTSPSARESRMGLLVSAVAKVPMQAVVLLIGALMYLLFTLHGSPLLYDPEHRATARTQSPEALSDLEVRYAAAAKERKAAALRWAQEGGGLQRYQDAVRSEASLREQALKLAKKGDEPNDPTDTNFVFPWFMFHYLPTVVLGLVMAAVFAAATSSAAAALNALTAAFIVDFWRRWLRPRATERQAVWASRVTTLLWGTVSTLLAVTFYQNQGALIERINEIGSWFYGSLLGVFVLAFVCKRAGERSAVLGLLGGMALVFFVGRYLRVEFLWLNLVGCAGVLAVGIPASLFERHRPASSS